MANGTTARQKILDLLVSQKEPITKKTITNQTGLSETTVDLNCTELRRAGLIDTGNGTWWATPVGREQHKINPLIGAFHTAAETERRENWAELLGPEVINSPICRNLIMDPPTELLGRLNPFLPYFVVAWLVTKGISIEGFDESKEANIGANEESDLVVLTFNFMLGEIAKQNKVNTDFNKS